MPVLYTRKEIAALLKVSIPTIIRWENQGKLPVLHIGENAVRYTQETVNAFLAGAAKCS